MLGHLQGQLRMQLHRRHAPRLFQSAPLRQASRPGHHVVTNAVATSTKRGEVLLIADTLGKTWDGEKELFYGLTFSVVAGDKLAIVGPNGSGKTTLLKVIAGLDDHDQGVLTRNKGMRVGYLAQDPELPPRLTVLEAVLRSDSDMARAVQQYQKALASAGGAITKELELAIERMNTFNAWEIDAEAKRVLEAVGIKDLSMKTDKMSGGQRKRVALAAALLGSPDLLILDEPTNHMDVEMIAWMERELAREEMAVVLVTHDRYFMENVCDRILELDRGKCFMHNFGGPGSYAEFKEAREFRRKAQANAAADARTLFRREAEWMAKQPKARQAKSMARQKQFYELADKAKDLPTPDARVDFGNVGMARQGNKVVRMEKVDYALPDGRKIINGFTYDFMPGERLGVVGPNGAGKSTLLDLITGVKTATSGRREQGDTCLVGYFTQHPPEVRYDMRVIDYIREVADTSRKARAATPGFEGNSGGGYSGPGGGFSSSGRNEEAVESPEVLLEKLGFPRPRQYQYVSSLSGGERRRLHLASVLVERPNLLILDEPTNDLDLQTVEVLEEVVRNFKGVVLAVSHDRAFMDNLAPRLLVLGGGSGTVRLFDGTYSEYLDMLAEEERQKQEQEQAAAAAAASTSTKSRDESEPITASSNGTAASSSSNGKAAAAAAPAAPPPAPAKKRKLGYYEEQEYKKLEKEVDDMGKKRDALNDKLVELAQGGASALAELEKASLELAKLQEAIDTKSERWLELAEIAGDL